MHMCVAGALRELMDDPTLELNRATCAHHKIGLIATAAQRYDHGWLQEHLGEGRDNKIREFRAKNMMDMFQRQLSLLFGHHRDSYVFGNGVVAFPKWFAARNPGVLGLGHACALVCMHVPVCVTGMRLHKMKRQVGNRHGVFLHNAMVHYAMFESYRTWIHYLKHDIKETNSLHIRALTKLQTQEVKAATRARGKC